MKLFTALNRLSFFSESSIGFAWIPLTLIITYNSSSRSSKTGLPRTQCEIIANCFLGSTHHLTNRFPFQHCRWRLWRMTGWWRTDRGCNSLLLNYIAPSAQYSTPYKNKLWLFGKYFSHFTCDLLLIQGINNWIMIVFWSSEPSNVSLSSSHSRWTKTVVGFSTTLSLVFDSTPPFWNIKWVCLWTKWKNSI